MKRKRNRSTALLTSEIRRRSERIVKYLAPLPAWQIPRRARGCRQALTRTYAKPFSLKIGQKILGGKFRKSVGNRKKAEKVHQNGAFGRSSAGHNRGGMLL
jgi:hypothetical protein